MMGSDMKSFLRCSLLWWLEVELPFPLDVMKLDPGTGSSRPPRELPAAPQCSTSLWEAGIDLWSAGPTGAQGRLAVKQEAPPQVALPRAAAAQQGPAALAQGFV